MLVSIHAPTDSEKPCYLVVEARGSRHGNLGLTDSCVETDCKAELAGWAGIEQSGLTWLPNSRMRAYWATLEQSG